MSKNKKPNLKKYSSYQLFDKAIQKIKSQLRIRRSACSSKKPWASIILMLDLSKLSLGQEIQLCANFILQSSLHTAGPLPNLRIKVLVALKTLVMHAVSPSVYKSPQLLFQLAFLNCNDSDSHLRCKSLQNLRVGCTAWCHF